MHGEQSGGPMQFLVVLDPQFLVGRIMAIGGWTIADFAGNARAGQFLAIRSTSFPCDDANRSFIKTTSSLFILFSLDPN